MHLVGFYSILSLMMHGAMKVNYDSMSAVGTERGNTTPLWNGSFVTRLYYNHPLTNITVCNLLVLWYPSLRVQTRPTRSDF
jgi:hypothetical protein